MLRIFQPQLATNVSYAKKKMQGKSSFLCDWISHPTRLFRSHCLVLLLLQFFFLSFLFFMPLLSTAGQSRLRLEAIMADRGSSSSVAEDICEAATEFVPWRAAAAAAATDYIDSWLHNFCACSLRPSSSSSSSWLAGWLAASSIFRIQKVGTFFARVCRKCISCPLPWA